MKKQELINSIAESRYLGRVFVLPKGFKFSGVEGCEFWSETRMVDDPNNEDYFFFRVMKNIDPPYTFEMCTDDFCFGGLSWYELKDCSVKTLQKIDSIINYRGATKATKQLQKIRQWCGKDMPKSFDVWIQDEYEVYYQSEFRVDSWAIMEDLCSRGSLKRNGMRIVDIYDYDASHKIIYPPKKQLTSMTKTEVLRVLNNSEWPLSGILEVICDIAKEGEVVHANHSILVTQWSVDYDNDNRDCDDVCDDDQIINAKHWRVCSTIDGFDEEVGYGPDEADCSGFYVSEFKDVRAFVSDFDTSHEIRLDEIKTMEDYQN